MRILKPILHKSYLLTIYTTLIQSLLDYGSPLYIGLISQKDSNKFYKLSKRCHIIICGLNCNKTNCLPDINTRRLKLSFKLFTNAISDENHILHKFMPNFLPSKKRLDVPFSINSRYSKSFIPFMSIHFNKM